LDEVSTDAVLALVRAERGRQDKKWGAQDHAIGIRPTPYSASVEESAKRMCERAFACGVGTWQDILREEFYELMNAPSEDRVCEEAVQLAAVLVQMVECIRRRRGEERAPVKPVAGWAGDEFDVDVVFGGGED
jgi:hypothetical protein